MKRHLNFEEVDLALGNELSGERLEHLDECTACRKLIDDEFHSNPFLSLATVRNILPDPDVSTGMPTSPDHPPSLQLTAWVSAPIMQPRVTRDRFTTPEAHVMNLTAGTVHVGVEVSAADATDATDIIRRILEQVDLSSLHHEEVDVPRARGWIEQIGRKMHRDLPGRDYLVEVRCRTYFTDLPDGSFEDALVLSARPRLE